MSFEDNNDKYTRCSKSHYTIYYDARITCPLCSILFKYEKLKGYYNELVSAIQVIKKVGEEE